jgi:transposase
MKIDQFRSADVVAHLTANGATGSMTHGRANVATVTQLVKDGKISRREAAEILKASIRTIHNYIKRYENHGPAGLIDHRGGHYSKLTPQNVEQIIHCKQERPQRSARWIQDRLKLNVSVETVRQILAKHHWKTDHPGAGSQKNAKTEFNRPQLITTEGVPMITSDTIVKVSNDVIVQELDGEAVLLDMKSEIYFGLDKIGTRIWTLLQTHGGLGPVTQTLLSEYEIGEQELQTHLLEFVEKLQSKGLVTIQDS